MSTNEASTNTLETDTERPVLRPQRPPPPPPTQSEPSTPNELITMPTERIFHISIYLLFTSVYL
jgi:hypothetical protein